MIIEFAKGNGKLSVRCDGNVNIGHIADCISKWACAIDSLTAQYEDNHSVLSFALEGLSQGMPLNLTDLAQRSDNIIQQYQLQFSGQADPNVTLWWARRPLVREQTLASRFADNGDRTRIAVALGPLDPNAVIEQPVALLSSQQRNTVSTGDVASKKANHAYEKAKQVLISMGETETSFQNLSSLQPGLSPSIKSFLIDAFQVDDPHAYLDNAMNNNSELREFADQVLLAMGKAQRQESSNIAFTG